VSRDKRVEDLRGAVIGFGSIGKRHCENLARLGVSRRIVVRRPEGQNPAFVPPHGVRVVTSHAEAISAGLDFAIVANPTRFHVETARRYLATGIPVLLEKPISDNALDARELAAEAARAGVPASMAYCMRYHPAYAAARAALQAGTIGPVLYAKAWFESYLPGWHPWEDYRQSYAARKDLGGGALRTLDHEIDFLNWCLGSPAAVLGSSRRSGALEGDADDCAALLLGYADGVGDCPDFRRQDAAPGAVSCKAGENGTVPLGDTSVMATLTLALCRRDRSRGFEFVGSSGTLRYRWEEEQLRLVAADGQTASVLVDHRGYDINQMYLDLLADFLRVAAGGQPSHAAADLAAGLRAIEVCCQAEPIVPSPSGRGPE